MTTTLAKFKNARRGNYCDLPTIDVEILNLVPDCVRCNTILVWNAKGFYGMGAWEHGQPTECSYAEHPSTCHYCGCNDQELVTFRQYAWYDATECKRCGGSFGYAIGD